MVFIKICWIATALSAGAALLTFVATMTDAGSAPQEAAGAAMALAIAIIPYVFTRCMKGVITLANAPNR